MVEVLTEGCQSLGLLIEALAERQDETVLLVRVLSG